jgi:hypothetical protein
LAAVLAQTLKERNFTFSRTDTFGTIVYKGQRDLVIKAIESPNFPTTFSRDQVVAAIDQAAYEKTFKHGTQVVTIPESVQFHLLALTKLKQLAKVAPPTPTVGPIKGQSRSQGRIIESADTSHEAYSHDVLDMALKHYGYGRWDAPYWFLGPEPGMNGRENDLKERASTWIELGRGELIDCKEHHLGFGESDWHRPPPPTPPAARLQPTWRQLIRLLLATCDGTPPDNEDIRDYQRNRWGVKNENGETCVIELSSLAAPKLAAPGEHDLFRKERIQVIRERMDKHKPAFVVMYGVGQKHHWEEIAGAAFPTNSILKVGPSVLAFAKAPTSFGLPNSYWLDLAKKLRRK